MECLDCGHKGEPIGFDDCPMCGGYMRDPDKELDLLDDEDSDSDEDNGYDDGYGDDPDDDEDWQAF